MKSSRAPGRPNKALITKEKIVSAALDLISNAGYDGLTMAALARALGVVPSALYNHVSGREELMLLIEDAVMGKVDSAPLRAAIDGELPYRTALEQWAWSYREAFSDHAPLIHIIAVLPITGARQTVDMYESLVRVLQLAGVPEAQILPRIVALESFIYGSAYDVRAPENIFLADATQAPALAMAREELAKSTGARGECDDTAYPKARNPHADEPFRLGLQSLLADLPSE